MCNVMTDLHHLQLDIMVQQEGLSQYSQWAWSHQAHLSLLQELTPGARGEEKQEPHLVAQIHEASNTAASEAAQC